MTITAVVTESTQAAPVFQKVKAVLPHASSSSGRVVPIEHKEDSDPGFGAQIYGIDLNNFSDADFEFISDALHKHKLLVFKEQPEMLRPQQQYLLTSQFDPDETTGGFAHGVDPYLTTHNGLDIYGIPKRPAIPVQPQVHILGRGPLQMIYGAHSELVRSLASNPIRFSPVFQMEDFFDRYPGYSFDGSHITLNDQAGSDISRSSRNNSATELHSQRAQPTLHRSYSEQTAVQPPFTRPSMISRKSNPNRKRRSTASNLAHHTVSESSALAHEGASSTTSQQPYLVSPNLEQPHQFFTELPHHSAHRSSLSTPTDPSIQYTPPSSDFMHVDYSGLP